MRPTPRVQRIHVSEHTSFVCSQHVWGEKEGAGGKKDDYVILFYRLSFFSDRLVTATTFEICVALVLGK